MQLQSEVENRYTCAAVERANIARIGVVLLALAGASCTALAAKDVSVEELSQTLSAEQGKPDQKVAERLSDVVLTERVTAARLTQWEKEFPGPRTREALIKLSDEVAFLEPPAMDVLRDPPPDSETQERMLALANDYVRTMMGRLPNFSATRETIRFVGMPEQQSVFSFARNLGQVVSQGRDLQQTGGSKWLHSDGVSSVTVTYRDGKEVNDSQSEANRKGAAEGLTTVGEFGPIEAVVMGDTAQGEITWARWEQGTNDPIAVFRFKVPKEASHYQVTIPNSTKDEEVRPAYHGEIGIDPESGAILRLNIVADLEAPYQMMRAAILVEYAPVAIGDRTCTCPVHGVAFSKVPAPAANGNASRDAVEVQTRLNDVVFKNYHIFGSESRILTSGAAAPSGSPDSGTPEPAATVPGSAQDPGVESKSK